MGLMSKGREIGFQTLSVLTHVTAFAVTTVASYEPQGGNFGRDGLVQIEFEAVATNSRESSAEMNSVLTSGLVASSKKTAKIQRKFVERPTQLPKKSIKEQEKSETVRSVEEEVTTTTVVIKEPTIENVVKEEPPQWVDEVDEENRSDTSDTSDTSDESEVNQKLADLGVSLSEDSEDSEDSEVESSIDDGSEPEKSALANESEHQLEEEMSQLNHLADPNLAGVDGQENVGTLSAAERGGFGKTEGGLPKKLELGHPGGVKDGALLLEKRSMKPRYKMRDRLARREGAVTFHYTVTHDGNVRDIVIVQSSGHRSLDQESFKALKETRYFSGQGGRCKKTYNWSLRGGVEESPSRLRQAKR